MYMAKQPDNHTATVLNELYEIDPSLKQFEADLPRIISTLKTNRPDISVDQTFVNELRTSLLSYKPVATFTKTPATTPLFWFTRLVPVGISLVLLFMLIPDLTKAPSGPHPLDLPEQETSETAPPPLHDVSNEMRMDTFMPESAGEGVADDTSMLSMEATPTSLQVSPPLAGNTLTITSLTMPEDGWIVVYKDQGGELGEMLYSSFLTKGEYQELSLILADELLYTELVTVVVYTGTDPEQFNATLETVQIDPLNDSVMMLTVPVTTQPELESME